MTCSQRLKSRTLLAILAASGLAVPVTANMPPWLPLNMSAV